MNYTQVYAKTLLSVYLSKSKSDRQAMANKVFLHDHDLVYGCPNHEKFTCNACGHSGKGGRLQCSTCRFDLHLSCSAVMATAFGIILMSRAAAPRVPGYRHPKYPTKKSEWKWTFEWDQQKLVNRLFLHDHSLELELKLDNNWRCCGCGSSGKYWCYRCHTCGFKIHQDCSIAVAKAFGYHIGAKELEKAPSGSSVVSDEIKKQLIKLIVHNFVHGLATLGQAL